jgi:hypothetical protein
MIEMKMVQPGNRRRQEERKEQATNRKGKCMKRKMGFETYLVTHTKWNYASKITRNFNSVSCKASLTLV